MSALLDSYDPVPWREAGVSCQGEFCDDEDLCSFQELQDGNALETGQFLAYNALVLEGMTTWLVDMESLPSPPHPPQLWVTVHFDTQLGSQRVLYAALKAADAALVVLGMPRWNTSRGGIAMRNGAQTSETGVPQHSPEAYPV
ncbi:hypothetical protein NDU88_005630 [Pleurodeles waltl]|uniref:Uncharacterized protein n=1 Tax=Pleurodeles waltl TaxID=8319 RepID=A0AAV7LLR0_PLEWA|nr:hypothetical protein NDU88_005630 [Pleurodeles waltl]